MFGGGSEGGMALRPDRLLRRTVGRTLGTVGLLALRLGIARRALLILAGFAALVVGLLVLAVLVLLLDG